MNNLGILRITKRPNMVVNGNVYEYANPMHYGDEFEEAKKI